MSRLSRNMRKVVLNLWHGWRRFLGLTDGEAQLLSVMTWHDRYGKLSPEEQRKRALILLTQALRKTRLLTGESREKSKPKTLDHVHVYLGDLTPQETNLILKAMDEYGLTLYAVVKTLFLVGLKECSKNPTSFWTTRTEIIDTGTSPSLQYHRW